MLSTTRDICHSGECGEGCYTYTVTRRPTLRRDGDNFVVTANDATFSFPSFDHAIEALRFLSAPNVEDVFACDWLIDGGYTEDGDRFVRDCGAPAAGTARGWTCLHGHGHVDAEVRWAEGWDYGDDDEIEAQRLGFGPSTRLVPAAQADIDDDNGYDDRYDDGRWWRQSSQVGFSVPA